MSTSLLCSLADSHSCSHMKCVCCHPFCPHLSWVYFHITRWKNARFCSSDLLQTHSYVCMKELWWTFGDSIASGVAAKHTLLSLRYLKVILVTPGKCPHPVGSLDILTFCCNHFHSRHLWVLHLPVPSYLSNHLSREEPNKLPMYF